MNQWQLIRVNHHFRNKNRATFYVRQIAEKLQLNQKKLIERDRNGKARFESSVGNIHKNTDRRKNELRKFIA